MTDLNKRSMFKLAAVSALAITALAACGKKEEPVAAAPAPAAEAPAKAEPLKVAFAYVGPVGDGGWSFAHDTARKKVQEEYGDKIVTTFVESVPEGADAERVLRDLASQGNKLIFGTTFGYMDAHPEYRPDYKDVKFEHATGYKTAETVRTYDSRTYEGAYLAGVIAGGMTKSNTLGIVGSVPIPEVIRNINSLHAGCAVGEPQDQDQGGVGERVVQPTQGNRSRHQPDQRRRRRAVPEHRLARRAQDGRRKGKRAFGWDCDMTAYGPKAHLASAVINWGPVLHQGHQGCAGRHLVHRQQPGGA